MALRALITEHEAREAPISRTEDAVRAAERNERMALQGALERANQQAQTAKAAHVAQLHTLREQLRTEREAGEAREALIRQLRPASSRTEDAERAAANAQQEVGLLRQQVRQCRADLSRREEQHTQLLELLGKHEEFAMRMRAQATAIPDCHDTGLRVRLQEALAEVDQLKSRNVSAGSGRHFLSGMF